MGDKIFIDVDMTSKVQKKKEKQDEFVSIE
jgi:hypothetical protein